jgi:hypothetical protein
MPSAVTVRGICRPLRMGGFSQLFVPSEWDRLRKSLGDNSSSHIGRGAEFSPALITTGGSGFRSNERPMAMAVNGLEPSEKARGPSGKRDSSIALHVDEKQLSALLETYERTSSSGKLVSTERMTLIGLLSS